MEVWTTVACSKTRAALDSIQRAGERYETRSCMDAPPTPAELEDVLRRLGAEPWDIAREKESADAGFADLPRDADHRDDWVAALSSNPRAIQRPIILLDDGTAVVARDPETLDRVLGT
ncbi:arsenate reductase [Nocardioides sp.]|uniref:arsenate reductase n=1 Tax=Nocardioides sp. TaxID=35761 RepID=UPI002ED49E0E